jgi:predicted unusual protein kinase regulating ubiquinone biosynthesis (AarF/ABC1/UbiB family)
MAPDAGARLAELASVATALVRNAADHVQALVEDVADDSRDVAREAEALYESARERVEDARDALRAAPRLALIVSDGLSLLARHRLEGAFDAARAELAGEPGPVRDGLHARSARRARRLCERLRGGVLKLGQFASTRMDLLPEPWLAELSRLQDRVPPLPASVVAGRLAAELGPDWGGRFASFEPTPLAAASLAQVHGATLADDTPVAVKVLVPGIEDVVEADLAALRLLLPTLSDLLPRVDLATLAGELERAVRGELDLAAEARAAAELARAFAGDPDVIVPRVHPEASTRGVLVLERIEGERLLPFLAGCASRGEAGARDRDRVFEILIRSSCEQVLVHGVFQADPHPGNFLIVPGPDGPRLALLDFGCIERYDAALRRRYAELGSAILARDEARMATLFAEMGFRSRDDDPTALRAYAELLLEAFREEADAAGGLEAIARGQPERVERILALTSANPIVRIPGHFVLLGRVFATLGGLLLHHQPRVRLGAVLRPNLATALRPG